ncbi:MAG TPA: glycosyltransferase [Thermoanaerobaculia bacterium]|nr:glycosyltransferase [Thermoanaerobaculia bacterium]
MRSYSRAHLFRNTCVALYLGRPYLAWTPFYYTAARRLSEQHDIGIAEAHSRLLRELRRAWESPLLGRLARVSYALRRQRLFRRLEEEGRRVPALPAQAPEPEAKGNVTRGGRDPAPILSVVMLSYERQAYLQRALRALLARTPRQPIEVVVVDNGSTDGSADTIRAAFASGWISQAVLLRRNCGTSAAYNAGFHLADSRSKFLMKLDGDIEIQSPDWVERVVDLFTATPRLGIVSLDQDNHLGFRLLRTRRHAGATVAAMREWPCGSAMVIPRSVRQEIGPFVEVPGKQYIFDDVDYCNRVERHGLLALVLRDARVYHQRQLDGGELRQLVSFNQGQRAAEDTLRIAVEYDRGLRPIAWPPSPTAAWLRDNVLELLGG